MNDTVTGFRSVSEDTRPLPAVRRGTKQYLSWYRACASTLHLYFRGGRITGMFTSAHERDLF